MRKILVVLVFFLAMAIFTLSFSELGQIVKTLQNGDMRFIGLAILLQVLWNLNEAAGYKSIYKLMDVEEDARHLFLLSAAANFINVVAPSGGFGGVAVFVDDAGKRNKPRGLAAASVALYLFLEYAAFLGMLALGIVVLIRRDDLSTAELTASLIMVVFVTGFGTLLYIGSRSGEKLGNILAWMSRGFNRILWPLIHKEYFREAAAREFAMEVAEGLSILRSTHRRLLNPLFFAISGKILQATILLLAFLSFDVPYTVGTVIAGFATAYLFLVISPTPSGIGVVEGILPLALKSLGVPWADAVIITLTYRGLTFWFPLLLGGWAFRLLQRGK